jgi:hypothetical protein
MNILWAICGVFVVLFGGGFIWGFVVRGWEVKKLKKRYDDYFQLSIEDDKAMWIKWYAELHKASRKKK